MMVGHRVEAGVEVAEGVVVAGARAAVLKRDIYPQRREKR